MSSTTNHSRSPLLDLPSELILQIHLLALNPFFPQTHPQIYHSLTSPTPRYVATYLLSLYDTYGPSDILVRSVRHPICNVEVAKEMKSLWDHRRGYARPRKDPDDPYTDDTPSTPTATAPPLICPELPRRLFRHPPNPSQPVHPLLEYLFDNYSPSANSHKGYPLCRAVLTQNYPLISYLLSFGADPGIKSSLAVQIAISMKDVRAVKLLIERPLEEIGKECDDESGRKAGRERRRKKRRRLSDRLLVTPLLVECAMKKGARDIIHYFVEEKGVMPPLGSIMRLGQESNIVNSAKLRARSSNPNLRYPA